MSGHKNSLHQHAPAPQRVPSRTLLRRGAKFDVELLTLQGSDGRELTREVIRHHGSVIILPMTTLDAAPAIVLIRNYRLSLEKSIWELPAGTRGKTADGQVEDPRLCAARELEEETGFRAESLAQLTSFYTAPGLTDERMHAYVASGLVPLQQHLEPDEDIQVRVTPLPEVFAMIDRGEIDDAKSLMTILLADRRGILRPATS